MRKFTALVFERRFLALSVFAALTGALTVGCAAMSNPGVRAIPVHLLPPDLRGKSVAGMQTIPLPLLGQQRPEAYRIDGGDTLGVWVEGVLGDKGQQPPVQMPVRLGNADLPAAIGYPIQVQRDGTISLPYIEPLKVAGMTFKEAEDAIRRAYSEDKQILKDGGRNRIIVSLMRPRTYHVMVFREDAPQSNQTVVSSPSTGLGTPEYIGISRKGTGWELTLPAYQNDVLTALAHTGGLPGTDAIDAVIVQRNVRSTNFDLVAQEFQVHGFPAIASGGPVMRIPLRAAPKTPLPFRPEDVLLHDGDVVFVPAREERLFFTGGLLPPGQHLLPRDTDLDVLEAVARVRGPMFNGAFSVSNLSGNVLLPGLGQPTPNLLTVVRRLPGTCETVNIRVDMNRAVKDARERILVQAGDFLLLQEAPANAVARYITQMADIPFYYLFQIGPRLFTPITFSAPGGTAPSVITPQSINGNLSQSYIHYTNALPTSTGSNITTTPVPVPTGGGR